MGLYPLIVEKRTMLMELFWDVSIQKNLLVVAVNVTEVISSEAGSGGALPRGSAGCEAPAHIALPFLHCMSSLLCLAHLLDDPFRPHFFDGKP